jgi:hypothetical protein
MQWFTLKWVAYSCYKTFHYMQWLLFTLKWFALSSLLKLFIARNDCSPLWMRCLYLYKNQNFPLHATITLYPEMDCLVLFKNYSLHAIITLPWEKSPFLVLKLSITCNAITLHSYMSRCFLLFQNFSLHVIITLQSDYKCIFMF